MAHAKRMAQVIVRITPEDRERLRQACTDEDRNLTTIVRRAIRKYLDQPLAERDRP